MTLKDIQNRVFIRWHGYGCYYVTISHRRKEYFCVSHNSMAYDRIRYYDETPTRADRQGYTLKGAFLAFYDECKRKNNL